MLTGVTSLTAQENPTDFIEASIDNLTPYVGQPVLYTWHWYLATANAGSSKNARIVMPDFTGFGQETLPQADNQSRLINGRQYQVITQQILLYPLQAGSFNIVPVRIFTPETPFQPAITLETQTIALTVLSLPENAPATFKNAIGQFDIHAELNAASTTAGQPVTLTVIITGTGNTSQILAPDLPLSDGWRIYPYPPRFIRDTPQVGRQLFMWALIPLQAGTQTIPPVTFSFFNPQTAGYVTLTTAPLSLDVQPGQTTPEPRSTATLAAVTASPAPVLKSLPPVLNTASPAPSPFFWLLWLLPPLAAGAVWMRTSFRGITVQHRGVSPGSRALQQARAALKAAANLPPKAAYERAGVIILMYISAKTGKNITGQTASEAVKPLPEVMQKRLLQTLEQAETGRYAPVTAEDGADLLQKTLNLLVQVDQQWKKS